MQTIVNVWKDGEFGKRGNRDVYIMCEIFPRLWQACTDNELSTFFNLMNSEAQWIAV